MALFAGTTDFYRLYRSPIPYTVAAVLDSAVGSHRPRRLLDIATGTGLVVQALLGRFDDIIAIDSDPDMLVAAEASLDSTVDKGSTVTFVHATAEEFTPPDGWYADLVTICRAFHWLDQSAVLARLDAQVSPDGAVAIFADRGVWTARTPWKVAVRTVVQEFLGEQRRAGGGTFTPHRPFSDILAESPFNDVEELVVPVSRTRNADSVVGYLHSTSFAAPRLFGDRLAEFDAAVRRRLADFSSEDTFVDDNEFRILVGRRGSSRGSLLDSGGQSGQADGDGLDPHP